MAIQFVDEFFNTGLETEAVVKIDSVSKTIKGHFDNKYQAAKIQGIDFESSNPMFTCKSADVAGIKRRRDTLTVDGTEFTIGDIQPDGTGITILVLAYD